MTNNMIKAEDLTAGDRFETADGEPHTTSRVRLIDHLRCRIDTKEGKVIIARRDAAFWPPLDDSDQI
jgi:hypothetical protein